MSVSPTRKRKREIMTPDSASDNVTIITHKQYFDYLKQSQQNIRTCCRVCFSLVKGMEVQSIFTPTISGMLQKYLHIKPNRSGGYPESLCAKCHGILRDFSNLQALNYEWEDNFKKYLRDVDSDIEASGDAEVSETEVKNVKQERVETIVPDVQSESEEDSERKNRSITIKLEQVDANDSQDTDTVSATTEAMDDTCVTINGEEEEGESEANTIVQCTECNEAFEDLTDLKMHVLHQHAKSGKSLCHDCGAIIDDSDLTAHTEMCVGDGQLLLLCDLCGRSDFENQVELGEHIDEHNLPEKCSICMIKFKRNAHLIMGHIKMHADEPKGVVYSIKCRGHCDRMFKDTLSLQTHMNAIALDAPKAKDGADDSLNSSFDITELTSSTLDQYFDKTTSKYVCDICQYSVKIRNTALFYRHLKVHEEEPEGVLYCYQCDDCNRLFRDENTLDTHLHKAHANANIQYNDEADEYKCRICRYTNKRYNIFQIHVDRHNQEDDEVEYTIECDKCDRLFSTRHSQMVHIAKNHPEERPVYVCEKCSFTGVNRQYFLKHNCANPTANVDQRLECEQCGYFFKTDTSLMTHIKNVHQFPYKRNLETVLRLILEQYVLHKRENQMYACPQCSFENVSIRLVFMHIFEHEYMDCVQCHLTFTNYSELESHLFIEHQSTSLFYNPLIKKYVCPKCQLRTESRPQIQKHLELHVKEPVNTTYEYKCENCERLFRSEKYLQQHAPGCGSHVKCRHCNMLFETKADYWVHFKSEHRVSDIKMYYNRHVKRYICDVCRYRNSDTNAFRKHLRDHEEEPTWVEYTFECNECPVLFKDDGSLMKHQRLTHLDIDRYFDSNIRLYCCPHCEEKIQNPANFRAHFTTHSTKNARRKRVRKSIE